MFAFVKIFSQAIMTQRLGKQIRFKMKIIVFYLMSIFFLLNCMGKDNRAQTLENTVSYYDAKDGQVLYDNYAFENHTFNAVDFELIEQDLLPEHVKILDDIISNEVWHSPNSLATCEVSGLFEYDDKIVYCICVTSQIVVKTKSETGSMMLNDAGTDRLFDLIVEIRKTAKLMKP
jgi:hypothetical protein